MLTKLCLLPLAVALLAAAPAGAQESPIDRVGPLAINLDEFEFYSPYWPFTDAFKSARPWISQAIDNEEPFNTFETIPVTSEGWPLPPSNLAAVNVLFRELDFLYPEGVYTVFWEGSGTVEFTLDGTLIETVAPGHARIDVEPTWEGIGIKLYNVNPADPVRHIRVIMPGFESTWTTQTFHPDFLHEIEPFGVLRFMQWQETNFAPTVDWSERTTPADYSQAAEHGVAVEYLVELCNTADQGGWFSMPYLANDTFVREFAKYVAQNMEPELPVFIEYSNEVWNQDFLAYDHAEQQGALAGLPGTAYEQALRWYSQRAVQIGEIWRQEFEAVDGPAWSDRLVRAMGAQHANTFTSETVLDHNGAAGQVDVLATAPYFGFAYGDPANTVSTVNTPIPQIIEDLLVEVQGPVAAKVAEHVAIASARNVELIAYEGGQHMNARGSGFNNPVLVDKLAAINRDPGMFDVYVAYLNAWDQTGAGFMTPYSFIGPYSDYGSWGHKETLGQPLGEAHKFRALINYLGLPSGEAVTYGNGCQNLKIGSFGVPLIGATDFFVSLSGGGSKVPAQLLISGNGADYLGIPLPIDLSFVGALDCDLLVGNFNATVLETNPAGNLLTQVQIPNDPGLIGKTAYLQWTSGVAGFGLLELGLSTGLAVTIGG